MQEDFTRFAIYYTAHRTSLAEAGAAWLGWDIHKAAAAPLPEARENAVATPRKYGFHATIKPPFRLADGKSLAELRQSARALCAAQARFEESALEVSELGRFLALVPRAPDPWAQMAAALVAGLEAFRAPASEAELAKRRKSGLNARQDALLLRWGYPFVMEEFRFHMTLSGRLEADERARMAQAAKEHFAAPLAAVLPVASLSLCAERPDGRFEWIEELPFLG
ncbi:MAG: DUF1045 domain-containing protein [Pseudomonadota bacterium]